MFKYFFLYNYIYIFFIIVLFSTNSLLFWSTHSGSASCIIANEDTHVRISAAMCNAVAREGATLDGVLSVRAGHWAGLGWAGLG